MRLRAFAMLALALSLVAFGWQGEARANGVPQLVKLTYLPGVSNWGPTDGEGVLEFSFAEAYARVDVKNLKPADGYTYEGWLVAPDGTSFRVGDIPVSAAGVGTFQSKLEGLKRYDYNLFVVAGRAADSAAGALPAQKSIAGRFTVIADSPNGAAGETRPATLPDTGQAAGASTAERLGRVAALVAVAGGLSIAGFRLAQRRKAHD
jgi:hypothetical protein